MNRVKQWLFAIYLCRRYGLVWQPFVGIKYGSYNPKGVISINPFAKYFYDTFLHELGHHLHDERVHYEEWFDVNCGIYYTGNRRCIFRTLESEYRASKFAIRMGANPKYLLREFCSYIRPVMRRRDYLDREDFERYLDSVAKFSKYFHKNIFDMEINKHI